MSAAATRTVVALPGNGTVRILLSNDDGYQARGLRTLADTLPIADVIIVAPDRNRSGASNSLTLETPLRVERVTTTSTT